MEGVIISGLLFSVALFFTGLFCRETTPDELKNDTKVQLLLVFCVLTISVNATLLCMNINKCCSESSKAKMEFSLDEYDMSKKTIVVEGNDSTKTDTVYFFVRKSNN